jgi:hypothetical protein
MCAAAPLLFRRSLASVAEGGACLVETDMDTEAVELHPSRAGAKPWRVAPETWALIGFTLVSVAALVWFGLFALVNARAIGLI